jgi:hypothetical protein
MKDETYKKIYIKSESDLPKETGVYFCEDKLTGVNITIPFNPNSQIDVAEWMNYITWYLLPTQDDQAIIEKQEELIKNLTDQLFFGEPTTDKKDVEFKALFAKELLLRKELTALKERS